MATRITTGKLVALINKYHALLVYPLQNNREPLSLWSSLYPRKKMLWEWNEEGDDSVADLWHWRELLSRSGKVVYSKWYQNRATFFSKEAFTYLLASLETPKYENRFFLSDAKKIYDVLEEHSPQSTKSLKKLVDLQGRFHEPSYQKALKELFHRGLVIGWGEKDEGAFPSLQLGAAKYFFEEEWRRAEELSREQGLEKFRAVLKHNHKFISWHQRFTRFTERYL